VRRWEECEECERCERGRDNETVPDAVFESRKAEWDGWESWDLWDAEEAGTSRKAVGERRIENRFESREKTRAGCPCYKIVVS
jgi:hypothetical protein